MTSITFTFGAIAMLAACGDVASKRDVECGAQPVEVLPNGSFDGSTPPWVQDPVAPALLCGMPTITPVDPPQAACLGGTDGTMQTLSQTIPLPEGVKTLTLTGQICIDTAETVNAEIDIVQFEVVSGSITVSALGKRTNQQGTAGCLFSAFQLSAAAISDPATATFRIRSTLNTMNPTSFYIDKLSLEAACM